MGCFEELELVQHLAPPHTPSKDHMRAFWTTSQLTTGFRVMLRMSSFFFLGKRERGRKEEFSHMQRSEGQERPPHSELVWKTSQKSE